MTSAREIEVSVESGPEAYIGDRIITAGTFDSRRPRTGPDRQYWRSGPRLRACRSPARRASTGSASRRWPPTRPAPARSHGRARSFIPLVRGPAGGGADLGDPAGTPIRAAPAEGRVRRADQWAADLDPGGRLANLAAFVRPSGTAPVTWLIDPAVLDAVRPAGRAATPARPRADRARRPARTTPSSRPTRPRRAAEADANGLPEAARWLEDVQSSPRATRCSALAYGDLDVAAAARYAPSLYNQARRVANEVLDEFDIESTPGVVPPSGLINPAAFGLTPVDTEIFLSDEALPRPTTTRPTYPRSSSPAGRRIAVTDHRVAVGGPGPDDPDRAWRAAAAAARRGRGPLAGRRRQRPGRGPAVRLRPRHRQRRLLRGARAVLVGWSRRPWTARRGADGGQGAYPTRQVDPRAQRGQLRLDPAVSTPAPARRHPGPQRRDRRRRAPRGAVHRVLHAPRRPGRPPRSKPTRPLAWLQRPAPEGPDRGPAFVLLSSEQGPVRGHRHQRPRPAGAGPHRVRHRPATTS